MTFTNNMKTWDYLVDFEKLIDHHGNVIGTVEPASGFVAASARVAIAACRRFVEKGCHDTCSFALNPDEHACDCGRALAEYAVAISERTK